MSMKEIIVGVVILVSAMTIFSYISYPNVRQQTNSFFTYVGSKVQDIGASQNKISGSNFRCEEELSEWLKTEKIRLSSSVSVKVVEKKSFTNKTELLDYVDKWNSFNEYEIKKRIEEITKMPEPQGNYDLRREGKKFILDFDYQEGDINSMRMVVTKGYFNKETICDKTEESSKGTIECDISGAGEGEFKAEIYMDTVDKTWTGQIDTVLIKEEGQINHNDVAILVIGICEEEGKLSFK